MKRHTIKLEDFEGFTREIELAGSHSNRENKSLMAYVTFNSKEISFKVLDDNEIVAVEQDLEKAIEIYNEL